MVKLQIDFIAGLNCVLSSVGIRSCVLLRVWKYFENSDSIQGCW